MVYTTKPPFGTPLDLNNPLNDGLSALWIFNEGTGNKVYDLSGNNNTGTLIGMADPPTPTSGWNPGMNDVGLNFDGVNDYVKVGNNPSLNLITGQKTVAFFCKPTNGGYIIAKYNCLGNEGGWLIEIDASPASTGRLMASLRTASGTHAALRASISDLRDNLYHHVIVIFDYTTITINIYIDGVLNQGSQTGSGVPASSSADLLIGARCSGTRAFNGSIDEIRMWSRELNILEKQQLLNDPYNVFLEPCNNPVCSFTIT